MADIVPFREGASFSAQHPLDEVVKFFEGYLEEAKRGEIIGVAISVVRPPGSTTTDWTPGSADQHAMLAGVTLLYHKIVKTVSEGVDGPA